MLSILLTPTQNPHSVRRLIEWYPPCCFVIMLDNSCKPHHFCHNKHYRRKSSYDRILFQREVPTQYRHCLLETKLLLKCPSSRPFLACNTPSRSSSIIKRFSSSFRNKLNSLSRMRMLPKVFLLKKQIWSPLHSSSLQATILKTISAKVWSKCVKWQQECHYRLPNFTPRCLFNLKSGWLPLTQTAKLKIMRWWTTIWNWGAKLTFAKFCNRTITVPA